MADAAKKEPAFDARPITTRTLVALGLCFFLFSTLNNITWNIVMSSAGDLTEGKAPQGTILVAYTIPSIFVRLVVPYLPSLSRWRKKENVPLSQAGPSLPTSAVNYNLRLYVCTLCSLIGSQMLAWATPISTRVIGIVFMSLSSNLGEMTFLQLTTLYKTQTPLVLGAFASGTGASGVLGGVVYAFLTNNLQIKTEYVIAGLIIVPISIVIMYFFILPDADRFSSNFDFLDGHVDALDDEAIQNLLGKGALTESLDVSELSSLNKIKLALPLLGPYGIPLFTNFFFIFNSNNGIVPTLIYPTPAPPGQYLADLYNSLFQRRRDFFPVYFAIYQFAVFLSRSSVSFIRLPRRGGLWIPPTIAVCVYAALLSNSITMNGEGQWLSVWTTAILVFLHGICEGQVFSNAYWRLSRDPLPREVIQVARQLIDEQSEKYTHLENRDTTYEEPEENREPPKETTRNDVLIREFLVGSIAIADVAGVLAGSLFALVIQPALCNHQFANGRTLCRSHR